MFFPIKERERHKEMLLRQPLEAGLLFSCFKSLSPFTCCSGEGWLVGSRPNRNWRSTLLDVEVAVELGLGLAGYHGAFFVSTRVGMEPHLILVTG